MMEFAERLRGELRGLLEVIHRTGGGVVLEEFPGALEYDSRGAEPVAGESSAVRGALIEEANRLAEMLERLRHGEGGITNARSGRLAGSGAGATARPGPSFLLTTRPL